MAWSERERSKANEEGARSKPAMKTEAMERPGKRVMISLQLEHLTNWVAAAFQMRRVILGKSSQTLMPQKWEPSVQMGVVMPERRWHGGPIYCESAGCTSRNCAISSIEAW